MTRPDVKFTRCRCGEQVEKVQRDDGSRTELDADLRDAVLWPDGADVVKVRTVHRCPRGR